MADSELNALTAATAATGGIYYGEQSGASRKFTVTAAGASVLEAANAAAINTVLGLGTGDSPQFTNAVLSNELRILESGGPSYTGFKAPALAANLIYTLPSAFPGVGEQKSLVVDENGVITLEDFVTLGTGVATALAINVGSAGAIVTNGGALGTPSGGTLTNCTGLPPAGVTGTAAILGANEFTDTQVFNKTSASGNSQEWESNGTQKAYMRHDGFLMVTGIGVGYDVWYNSGQAIIAGWDAIAGVSGIYVNCLANHGPTKFDTPQTLSGAGGVNLTTTVTSYTSTGVAEALTLADGSAGQIKIIVHAGGGGGNTGVLTPTTKTGYTTITFTNVGETAILQFFTTIGWVILSINGAVAA